MIPLVFRDIHKRVSEDDMAKEEIRKLIKEEVAAAEKRINKMLATKIKNALEPRFKRHTEEFKKFVKDKLDRWGLAE